MVAITSAELLARARQRSRGVAAFNITTLEHAEAVVGGAELARKPVILQISQNAVTFHAGHPGPLAAAVTSLAALCRVPVALHLDHVDNEVMLNRADGVGFGSVMFDGGALAYRDNVVATQRVAQWGHERDLMVEAELGYVTDETKPTRSAHQVGVRTDPEQAAAFVEATGVDALAVAVGSTHAMSTRTAHLDLDLIAELRSRVPVPLVLHGSSAVPDKMIAAAVSAGVTKITIGKLTSRLFAQSLRTTLNRYTAVDDPRFHLTFAREAVASAAARLIGVVSAARK